MASPASSWFSPARLIKDLLVVIPAHAFWTWVCWAHVPLQEPMWILIGALFTAGPLTGTTWMAYHMFRVVYLHEQEKKRAAGR